MKAKWRPYKRSPIQTGRSTSSKTWRTASITLAALAVNWSRRISPESKGESSPFGKKFCRSRSRHLIRRWVRRKFNSSWYSDRTIHPLVTTNGPNSRRNRGTWPFWWFQCLSPAGENYPCSASNTGIPRLIFRSLIFIYMFLVQFSC